MNWAEFAPGIILIALGLSLLLLVLLGTGRKKTFTVPVINASFPAPSTRGQKIGVGLIGLALSGLGVYLLLIPLQTPNVGLTNITGSPTANATQDTDGFPSVYTTTLTPLPSDVATQLQTLTATFIPTQILSPTPIPNLANGCISSILWTPFEGQSLVTDDLHCWQMLDWGIVSQDGGLLISVAANEKSHGIYRVIPTNTKISFRLRIDRMRTIDSLEPRLLFGVIPLSPTKPADGKYLLLQRESAAEDKVFVKLRDPATSINDEFLPIKYSEGETHKVSFIIENFLMTIYLDNGKVDGSISLPFSERAFWIGYDLPPQTSIQVFLSDFSFEEK